MCNIILNAVLLKKSIHKPKFGVFDADAGFKGGETPDLRDAASLSRAVLQPGNKLLAAGYCLYSSTTMLVFTLGGGTHGFTLDKTINEFVLTHPNMKIPKRGNIYSKLFNEYIIIWGETTADKHNHIRYYTYCDVSQYNPFTNQRLQRGVFGGMG